MAFSALEALQAFGAGRQMAQQDRAQTRTERDQQRQDTERNDLSKSYDPATGQIDPVRARQAYVGAGDIGGALAFDQHMEQIHGAQFTQNRDRLIAGASFLSGVHDEAGYQSAIAQAHASGIDLANVPPHYDPEWVRNVVTIGTHLQAAQHYQGPTAFMQDAASAGIMPGTSAYRDLAIQHLATPRIMMVDGVPTLVAGGGAGGSQEPAPQEAVNPQTGERLRLNPTTQQWEPVPAGGAASGQSGFPRQDGGAFDFNANAPR